MSMTPNEIINGFRNGNKDVIINVYKAILPNVQALLRRYDASDEAENHAWDGITIFWEKCKNPDFAINGSPNAYIYRICKNKWIDRNKKDANIYNIDDLPSIPDEDGNSIEELWKIVEDCLNQMRETCQTILRLLHKTNNMQEIAQMLEITYVNARQRKHACITELTERIKSSKNK